MAGEDEQLATFLNGEPPARIAQVSVRPTPSGRWTFAGSSHGCRPGPFVEGHRVPSWKVDEHFAHRRDAKRVHALSSGSYCSSGRPPKNRMRRPIVSYGQRRIVIAAVEAPPRGDQTCPGNPQIAIVLRLRESIGARAVVDASAFPFRRRLDLRPR